MVTPNKDNNVRVRLSRNADNANKKLSLIRVRIKNIYTDKSKYFFPFIMLNFVSIFETGTVLIC